MKTESEQVPRWDDIIFENRNKEYGAYTIRKNYDDTVLTGLTVSLGVVTLIFLSSFLSLKDEAIIKADSDIIVCTFVDPNLKPIKTLKEQPPVAPRHTPANVPPVAVSHDVPDEPPVPVDPPISGSENGTGDPEVGSSLPGSDLGIVAPPEPPKPEFYLNPEVAPEYKGGLEAMMTFIQRKMHYPAIARRKGDEGTVYVSFVISSSGAVTRVEVIKGISKECDQEAIRVISMMSKWKPGLQNKMPVAVKLVLPIKFKISG